MVGALHIRKPDGEYLEIELTKEQVTWLKKLDGDIEVCLYTERKGGESHLFDATVYR